MPKVHVHGENRFLFATGIATDKHPHAPHESGATQSSGATHLSHDASEFSWGFCRGNAGTAIAKSTTMDLFGRTRFAALALTLALSVAGCGGGDVLFCLALIAFAAVHRQGPRELQARGRRSGVECDGALEVTQPGFSTGAMG